MCGQVGVIFGTKRRRQHEVDHLVEVFVKALVLSEKRGPHATGVAWVKRDGQHSVYKQPIPASVFLRDEVLHSVLSDVDTGTTILMGHTRWKTRGDQRNNANNHPICAGNVIGTHNGHIANADYLFRSLGLPRLAEVDSEVIFRIADSTLENGILQAVPLSRGLSHCQGQISAVMVSLLDPKATVIVKGDKPLEFRYHRRYRALIYASEGQFLDAAIRGERGWVPIQIYPMSLLVFHSRVLMAYTELPLEFGSPSTWSACGGAR